MRTAYGQNKRAEHTFNKALNFSRVFWLNCFHLPFILLEAQNCCFSVRFYAVRVWHDIWNNQRKTLFFLAFKSMYVYWILDIKTSKTNLLISPFISKHQELCFYSQISNLPRIEFKRFVFVSILVYIFQLCLLVCFPLYCKVICKLKRNDHLNSLGLAAPCVFVCS